MALNQKQFEQLTEMGISVWQPKIAQLGPSSACSDSNITSHNQKTKNGIVQDTNQDENYLLLTDNILYELSVQRIFLDILQVIDVAIGEIILKPHYLDLGMFNWYFCNASIEQATIYCENNNLVTPSIALIRQSPALKKQLWQTIISSFYK